MPRVTDIAEVRAVLEFSEELTDIDTYVKLATDLVDACCVDGEQSDDRLKQIEVYLTAHFIAIYEVQSQSESAGPVSTTFRGKTDLALNATLQGQQALLLDLSGGLARQQLRATGKLSDESALVARIAGVTWLGDA